MAGVTFRDPLWRFIATNPDSATITWLDNRCFDREVTVLLNRPRVFTGAVPSDDPEINRLYDGPGTIFDDGPYINEGDRLVYGFRKEVTSPETTVWTPRFGGLLMQVEDHAESDIARTRITAYDPWQYLYHRPIRNSDGDLPGKNGISWDDSRVDVIARQLLKWTIDVDGPCMIDAGVTYGGTAFYTGTVDACPQIDINFPRGMMVGEAWDELVSLGLMDIVLEPIYDVANL